MTVEQLKEKQAQMSDVDLILNVERQITELARTGGRSLTMCVPPEITDTDMILSELVRRFKLKSSEYKESIKVKCNHPLEHRIGWHDSSVLCTNCNEVIEQYGVAIN